MLIRSNTWGAATISWSVVMEELLWSAKKKGHTAHLISTNGVKGTKYWTEKQLISDIEQERKNRTKNIPYDIDITFTVPQNFPQRFLKNSKHKMAIYDYESSHMPASWKKYYGLVDYVLPGSNYVGEMFARNGCPREKIVPVHHGVDLNVFNPEVEPLKLVTDKKVKMLCVGEPHYRKQIDKLLKLYCKTFTNKDDITLILKTKIFKPGEEKKTFEVDLRKTISDLKKKHGKSIPEFKILNKRIDNIASLYTACDFFGLMTASEGWGMPFLEAMACGLPVIAPNFGGQLDFLNKDNAILTKCGKRLALPQEQYWGRTKGATTGNPDEDDFARQMVNLYKNHKEIKEKLMPHMMKTVPEFTWDKALDKIVSLTER